VCVVWDSRPSDFSGRVTKSGKVAGSLAPWSRGRKPLKPGRSHNHSRVIWFPEIELLMTRPEVHGCVEDPIDSTTLGQRIERNSVHLPHSRLYSGDDIRRLFGG